MATRKQTPKPAATVLAWEDDPMSTGAPAPIARPVPNLKATPFALAFSGRQPAAANYAPGTTGFRYWTAAEALRRAADFWVGVIKAAGRSPRWQPGATLAVYLDQGVDLNAYYDRRGLNFFHETVSGTTVYSGESPDVTCHELGHAVLDSVCPDLWDAASDEVAAFHESFGDMSAILSALQLQEVRTSVLAQTSGKVQRSSSLSRLAEQLGWAIRLGEPDAVDADCLRNAANSFYYADPSTLAPSGPASSLSSEPHNFSRVFTGAFYAAFGGMVAILSSSPKESTLAQVSADLGQLLIRGVLAAPVTYDYYQGVATAMIAADRALNRGKYVSALQAAFVGRGILTPAAAAAIGKAARNDPAVKGVMAKAGRGRAGSAPVAWEQPGEHVGLPGVTFSVQVPGVARQMMGARGAKALAAAGPEVKAAHAAAQFAARAFVDRLFRKGRVDLEQVAVETKLSHHHLKTHAMVKEKQGVLALRRRLFDCGFCGGC